MWCLLPFNYPGFSNSSVTQKNRAKYRSYLDQLWLQLGTGFLRVFFICFICLLVRSFMCAACSLLIGSSYHFLWMRLFLLNGAVLTEAFQDLFNSAEQTISQLSWQNPVSPRRSKVQLESHLFLHLGVWLPHFLELTLSNDFLILYHHYLYHLFLLPEPFCKLLLRTVLLFSLPSGEFSCSWRTQEVVAKLIGKNCHLLKITANEH